MTVINLDSAIDRMVALEIEALAALSPTVVCDALPYFFHTQEAFPYWTNRIGPLQIEDQGEDYDRPIYNIISRLVIGHLTDDYDGQNEDKLKIWIPQIVTYFHQHPRLQTATLNTGLSQIVEARITSATGLRVLQSAGISTLQIGCEFTHRLEFLELIDLTYG